MQQTPDPPDPFVNPLGTDAATPSGRPPAQYAARAPGKGMRVGIVLSVAVVGGLFLCCIGGGALSAVGLLLGGASPSQPAPASPTIERTPAPSTRTPEPVRTTALPTPSATPPSTPPVGASRPASTRQVLPAYDIFERRDVSSGSGARRLALRVELHVYPVSVQQVIDVVAHDPVC